jgi:acyl dehydratase
VPAALTARLPAPFAAGTILRSPSRTITEADFSAIINVTWENGPLHTDAEYMKDTVFGRPILGGPCLVGIAAGLTSNSMYAAWYAAGVDCYAALGIDEVRYDAPLYAGDTIHADILVAKFEPTPNGTAYYGEVHDTLKKQDGQTVLRMKRSYLLKPLGERA